MTGATGLTGLHFSSGAVTFAEIMQRHAQSTMVQSQEPLQRVDDRMPAPTAEQQTLGGHEIPSFGIDWASDFSEFVDFPTQDDTSLLDPTHLKDDDAAIGKNSDAAQIGAPESTKSEQTYSGASSSAPLRTNPPQIAQNKNPSTCESTHRVHGFDAQAAAGLPGNNRSSKARVGNRWSPYAAAQEEQYSAQYGPPFL